jgi:hypothetical protein
MDPAGMLTVVRDKKKDGHTYGGISDDPVGAPAPGVFLPVFEESIWGPSVTTLDFLWHYEFGNGKRLNIPARDIHLLLNDSYIRKDFNYGKVMWNLADHSSLACDGPKTIQTNGSFRMVTASYGGRVGNTPYSIATDSFHVYGGTVIRVVYNGMITIECGCDPEQITKVTFNGTINYIIQDEFANPADIDGPYNKDPENEFGIPYKFSGSWRVQVNTTAHFDCGEWPSEGDRERSEDSSVRGSVVGDERDRREYCEPRPHR